MGLAQWSALERFARTLSTYQTCHRRFQNWVRSSVLSRVLKALAEDLRQRGEIDEALALYKQALPKWEELGQRAAVAHELECIAFIHAQQDQLDRAVTLLGAAEALRVLIDSAMTPQERVEYDQSVAQLRAMLDDTKFNSLWAEGRAMTMEQAIQFARLMFTTDTTSQDMR